MLSTEDSTEEHGLDPFERTVATGVLSAIIAPTVIDGPDVAMRAFAYDIGQWPATMAVAGWTTLLVGVWPRTTWLAWTSLIVGGTFALLGQLLGIPQRLRDLGVFQHVPDIASPNPDIHGLLILLTFATGAILLGIVGTIRRDITTG